MASRFEKFTVRARRVLSLSQEEAQRLSHNHLGNEHILLGIMRQPDCTAAMALIALGIEFDNVRMMVESIARNEPPARRKFGFNFKRSEDSGVHGADDFVGLAPPAKITIEYAVDEARRLNLNYIGTEHFLIGLMRVQDDVAANILKSGFGLSLDKIRREIDRVRSQAENSTYRSLTKDKSKENLLRRIVQLEPVEFEELVREYLKAKNAEVEVVIREKSH